MNKTDKKREKELIKALTYQCESFKEYVPGFDWLTHTGTLSPFNIKVTCVFLTTKDLELARVNGQTKKMTLAIEKGLKALFTQLTSKHFNVAFATEENCQLSDQKNWQLKHKNLH